MVLRGAQFQRSGPAGCAFLTRRALSPSRATLVHGHLIGFHGGVSPYNLTEDSRRMAREGDLCHGDIGESSSVSQP